MRRILFLALAVIVFLTIPYIEVHAQSIIISNLLYPERIARGSSARIQADFIFHNSVPGYYVDVDVWDRDSQTITRGSVTTEPGSCELGPVYTSYGDLKGFQQGEAGCYIRLSSSSGIEHATFLINLPTSGIHHLKARATLIFPPPVAYNADRDFTIFVTNQLTLTITAPSQVTVSLDGVPQLAGSVGLFVIVGTHTISVPSMVQVDNSTRLRFDSWSDGSTETTRTLNLQDDVSLTVNYVTQYGLTLTSIQANATGSGWYDAGSSVSISIPPRANIFWVFQGWYEGSNLVTKSNTGSISVNSPHTLTTRWGLDYPLLAGIIGAVATAGVGLAYYHKKLTPFAGATNPRRRRTSRKGAFSEPASTLATVSDETTALKDEDRSGVMFCKECGARISRDSKFCKECGTKFT